MRNVIFFLAILGFIMPATVFGQVPPVKHASAEVKEKQRERADYKDFRKQIMLLKEYADEKKKIPKLAKDSKEPVKIIASIDSIDGGDEIKTLTGYITQQIGDNSINAYELTYDRATKKITAVKKTGDGVEPEVAEAKEKPAAKEATKKKPATAKKKDEDGDDEEEADEPEDKPSKTTKKGDAE